MIPVLETRRSQDFDPEPHPLHFEHVSLRASARHLESTLGSIVRDGAADAGAATVPELLARFRRRFADHLAAEEGDRILERAVATEPRFARRVERLRREHVDLRRHLDVLAIEAVRADWRRLHLGFVAFHRAFRAHDEAENDVLQRTYLEDDGGGD